MLNRLRRARDDEGSVAVITAVTIPVVLLVIALAMATLVWAASETETQRAADQAAVEAAASALLADFPYSQVTTLDKSLYPTAATVASSLGRPLPDSQLSQLSSACSTIADPTTAIEAATGALVQTADGTLTTATGSVGTVVGAVNGLLPTPLPTSLLGLAASAPHVIALPMTSLLPTPLPTLSPTPLPSLSPTPLPTVTATPTVSPTATPTAPASLPAGCAGLGSVAPIPDTAPVSKRDACETAQRAMDQSSAPYANNFYGGSDSLPQATCANGRIRIGLSTNNPLLGFGTSTVDGVTDGITPSVPSQLSTVQQTLAPAGVHLDTALPNLVCPQVNVEVDQPVREPIFQHDSTPNGRATAQRVVKNAVVVPVFNGLAVASASSAVSATASGSTPVGSVSTSISGGVTTSVTLSAVDLNPTLLADQARLLRLLDKVDTKVSSTLTRADAQVDRLNGTLSAVPLVPGATLPPPSAATQGSLSALSLTRCLKSTLTQLFDPPTSGAPSVGEVADNTGTMNAVNDATAEADAAKIQQMFADAAASGDPIELVQVGVVPCAGAAMDVLGRFNCLQTASGTALSTVTGLYDVPLFDVTPVIVRDVGGGHYQAIPVHASQANGAFRATLVRNASDTRYDPPAALAAPQLPDAMKED